MLPGNKPIGSVYYFVSLASSVHIPQTSYLLCLKEGKKSEKLYVTYIIHPMVIVTLSLGVFAF